MSREPTNAPYPLARPRRSRAAPWRRALVAEHRLTVSDFIWPIFVIEGEGRTEPIASMPGVERLSVDIAVERVAAAAELGVRCVALFPKVAPELKTPACEEAWNPDNLVCRATRALKAALPEVGVMHDVALDPYNALGHDGLVRAGRVVNDETVEKLVLQSRVQAAAGADILGPSDMMDGRIRAIREGLEADGAEDVLILSYAAKYASGFYGPFREAVGADAALAAAAAGDAPKDKKTYQMDPANAEEAVREAAMDLAEGADWIMVKPGLPYLDICARLSARLSAPLFAYQVSGEYAMLAGAAERGWLDRRVAVLESLLAFKRAGCDGVLTYFAVEAAAWLREEQRAGG
ncbi:MAG: porphobilinogen synthase [Pseudomonadota bacterium]